MELKIFIIQFISVALAFGLVVFVHEFGHFIVARFNKIGVSTFSIGFGPRLFSYKDKSGTEWQFSLIPLGGFVKFYGDENFSSLNTETSIDKLNVPGQFINASVFSRLLTVLAGPLANFFFSIVIFFFLFLFQGIPSEDPIVGDLNSFYQERYDLKTGDRILEVEGNTVNSFSEIFTHIKDPQIELSTFLIERDSQIREIKLPYLLQPIIQAIEPLSAASMADLAVGDVFLEVNGKKLNNFSDLREAVISSKGETLSITIFRDGQ
ncbi:RIP metalloprotease RseP, partial [Paracoccaceae bacterium]|nr:RIP metalloprotease RseP [Paracoccaceae bacterium]